MYKPSKYINDICHDCRPGYYKTPARYTEQERIVEVVGDPDESYAEYLYECCGCGEIKWIDEQWVRNNAVICGPIQQRKSYIAHKSKQLDNIEDAHKFTRRLARIMLYHKLLTEIEAAAAIKIIKGDEEMVIEKMIKELETKCKSSQGSMGVDIYGVETVADLIGNVKIEIYQIEDGLQSGYIEEDYGMKTREAKGYLTKLNNFLKRHSLK